MKSIITTYPDFHALPKGIKRMLLATESFFFNEPLSHLGTPGANSRFQPKEFIPSAPRTDTPFSIFGSAWKN